MLVCYFKRNLYPKTISATIQVVFTLIFVKSQYHNMYLQHLQAAADRRNLKSSFLLNPVVLYCVFFITSGFEPSPHVSKRQISLYKESPQAPLAA